MKHVVIGTRGSSLAMCQTRIVQSRLEERFPGQAFTLHPIKAEADKNPELPLTAMSGEGVFVKELEAALLDGRIDPAVHSLKDLPLAGPPGLRLAAILARDDPRDALLSRGGLDLAALPGHARVGTSSPRRRSQLLRRRPDLEASDIRGNVETRLRKLDAGQYDAIIVAACGLIRLGLEGRITEYLGLDVMLPEPGQGALAVEARADDRAMLEVAAALDDPESRACVEAERALLRALGGGCRVPIAAFASLESGELVLQAVVAAPDGSADVRGSRRGPATEPIGLGETLAAQLLERGAEELLSKR